MRKEKCLSGCTKIKFLGHVISGRGIKPDSDKIKAIVNLEPPPNKTEARWFLSMIDYLMKFSNNLSGLCVPLYAVSSSKSEWLWGGGGETNERLSKV